MSDTMIVTLEASPKERRVVKSAIPNLFIMKPSGIYYGRVKVGGKTIKTSFETTSFEVAKKNSGLAGGLTGVSTCQTTKTTQTPGL
jgi:hypothetical protein